ncbi:AAA family ATPase [Candidatus Liberibacter asiaticus]|uniref:Response regulator receiver protein n=3 Tax=Liberibacter asiaticus TaxID=34021 RepID=C6XFP5_LIBAP|nr:AAA family ATPase [Candidatus Liberibacter asiaticus]ACT57198.1 response regulator receiver protein [Candidatus Liberibacter asiaticus str. psy62]AGH16840.1 response regulator receiver protein [Candidatus Liberibacter asiaticus str. gxpsy]ALK07199.1 AAA family ATPase [Candidatus Liberibacter asiaticus]ASK52679.1 CtpF protein [Candidatus Liberibacter asiaticus]AWL14004.1 CtpF protein [Candidatus Liberibacter asiaticus]
MNIGYDGHNSDFLENEDNLSESMCSLPRISVHVFCVTDTLYSVVERSKIDPRMSQVNMRITRGSIAEAVSCFSDSSTPDLIIVQTKVDSREVLSALEPLAEVCDSGTKVIVIGDTNDVSLYRALISNHVSEYLIEPLSVADIINSISAIFTPQEEGKGSSGCSISFIGSRGGVGSSTIAHNCAFSIASVFAMETLLADLDLPYGTANINFDKDPINSISDAIYPVGRIDKAFVSRLPVFYAENLSILTAPAMLSRTYDFDEKMIVPVLDILEQIFPLVILDVPHVWNSWTQEVLTLSDKVVITTSLDLAGLRNSKNLIDVLKKLRPADKPPYLVLNQVKTPKKPEISISDFCAPLGITPSAIIPFDGAVFGMSANSGKMIHEVDPKSAIANLLVDFSRVLMGRVTVSKPQSAMYTKIKKIFNMKCFS